MSSAVIESISPAKNSPLWIISRRDDLLWFQGSVLAGMTLLLFFALHPALSNGTYTIWNPVVMVLLLWGLLFDGTHVWGTYARTYFAPDAESRAALPGHWSWLVIVVGPAIAVVDHLLLKQGPSLLSSAGWLFRSFMTFAYLWAYWHLVRQHYGFLMLYRRKAGETDRRGARLDTLLLWTGTLYPYLRFSLSDSFAKSGLPQLVPLPLLEPLRIALDVTFFVVFAALLAVMFSGRFEKLRLGPKHLLLAVVIGFTFLVFALLDNLLTITATLTIFHNLQYHRIVWQYENGRGRTPSGGLAAYLAFGLLLGAAWYVPRVYGVALAHDSLTRNILLGLGWGVAFHHYVVDARIWRVRTHKSVAAALDAGAVRA
ncbi:MAG: hypothetical protein M3P29_02905 [Acidobacteriota bacterium]|nr:hypothetical protein [Acidobacteriota bacterium]